MHLLITAIRLITKSFQILPKCPQFASKKTSPQEMQTPVPQNNGKRAIHEAGTYPPHYRLSLYPHRLQHHCGHTAASNVETAAFYLVEHLKNRDGVVLSYRVSIKTATRFLWENAVLPVQSAAARLVALFYLFNMRWCPEKYADRNVGKQELKRQRADALFCVCELRTRQKNETH